MIETNSKQNFCVILLRIYSINILHSLLFFICFSIDFFLKLSLAKKFKGISRPQASKSTEDTSKLARKLSGGLAESILISDMRVQKCDNINFLLSKLYINLYKNECARPLPKQSLVLVGQKKIRSLIYDRILKKIEFFQTKYEIGCYPRGLKYLLFFVSRMLDKLLKDTNLWLLKQNQTCFSTQIPKYKKRPQGSYLDKLGLIPEVEYVKRKKHGIQPGYTIFEKCRQISATKLHLERWFGKKFDKKCWDKNFLVFC